MLPIPWAVLQHLHSLSRRPTKRDMKKELVKRTGAREKMKHERERGEAIFAAYSMDEAKNLGCPLTPTYKMQVLHSPAEDEEETYSCKVSQSSDKKKWEYPSNLSTGVASVHRVSMSI